VRYLVMTVAMHPAIAPIFRDRPIDAGFVSEGERVVRSIVFDSADDKARWLDAMATLDARLPLVREVARRFAKAPVHDPNNPEALARDFARFVRDAIKYVKDPAGEELSDAEQTLRQGYGDCDDKARLFVALCRSMQIMARIRPCAGVDVRDPDDFVHVQAEVKNDRGGWDVVELIVRGLDYGKLPKRGKQVLQ
jgi:transglutaminase-like putative cysteine protease